MSIQEVRAVRALWRAGWSRGSIAKQLKLPVVEVYRSLSRKEQRSGKARRRNN